jgi:hypothetical protein
VGLTEQREGIEAVRRAVALLSGEAAKRARRKGSATPEARRGRPPLPGSSVSWSLPGCWYALELPAGPLITRFRRRHGRA